MIGHLVAHRGGHALHTAFAAKILEEEDAWRLVEGETETVGAVPRSLYEGFRNFELARTDASIATWYNGQSGLFRTTILRGGSEEQVVRWLPLVDSFEMAGAFALTEPDHGSDIAGGLRTSATREGDRWRIDGVKRWIGSVAFADHVAVMARDVADGAVKAFLVRTDAPGVALTPIRGTTSSVGW